MKLLLFVAICMNQFLKRVPCDKVGHRNRLDAEADTTVINLSLLSIKIT